jgi:N-acetyl-anhydromuramyl-L-alanine amidase AmpD
MHGGVFKRRGNIKYIILHSTETARAADAQRVIRSWSNRGLRHPGAQFVVDRDGVIYCTADPTYGTSHVDEHRTKFGVNNDNSVGIEMVRTGDQDYTAEQMQSISCLVSYLQQRYSVDDAHIFGHGKVQPSDRSDPVNFNWQAFAADKDSLRGTAYNTALHLGM